MIELLQTVGTGLFGAIAFFLVMAVIVFIIEFLEQIIGVLLGVFCIAALPCGAYQFGSYLIEQIP